MKIKVLITGSTGMVGRNATEKLLEIGFDVLAPTRKELDLIDSREVSRYFKSNKIDIVIHAAGLVGGIQANIEKPYVEEHCQVRKQFGRIEGPPGDEPATHCSILEALSEQTN